MSEYQNERDYLSDLKDRAVLPSGFRVAAVPISFFPTERAVSDPLKMNLSLIALDKPTESFAAVFTRNAFPGAPVKIGRRRLSEAKAVSGVLIKAYPENKKPPILGGFFIHRIGTCKNC